MSLESFKPQLKELKKVVDEYIECNLRTKKQAQMNNIEYSKTPLEHAGNDVTYAAKILLDKYQAYEIKNDNSTHIHESHNIELKDGYLGEYFSESRFLASREANKHGIDNTFKNATYRQNAIILCTKFLDTIRRHYNTPVIVTSGYRTEELNEKIGGSETSSHMYGLAADFYAIGVPLKQIFNDIVGGKIPFEYDYDEVIYERDSWIHFGISLSNPKKEAYNAVAREINGEEKIEYIPVKLTGI